jgi:intracellular sulfur oxidation DsrE/DsrF family protein
MKIIMEIKKKFKKYEQAIKNILNASKDYENDKFS